MRKIEQMKSFQNKKGFNKWLSLLKPFKPSYAIYLSNISFRIKQDKAELLKPKMTVTSVAVVRT